MSRSRPSLYGLEILEKTQGYLDNYESLGDVIPSNKGLSLHIGVDCQTIQIWQNDEGKEDFSYLLDRLQAKQELVLLNKGLVGEFNSNICKLILTKHGYSDRQDTQLSGPNGGPVKHEWQIIITDSPRSLEKGK